MQFALLIKASRFFLRISEGSNLRSIASLQKAKINLLTKRMYC